MNRLPKESITSITAVVICIARTVHKVGLAIRNNELLDEKGIETDVKDTLNKLNK